MAGIYIHVPFCKQKCTYCDFASYPKEIGKAESYFACLYREIEGRSKQYPKTVVDTVYIGGGTPSVVDAKFIAGAIRQVKKCFTVKKNAEITVELNPGTVDENKIKEVLEIVGLADLYDSKKHAPPKQTFLTSILTEANGRPRRGSTSSPAPAARELLRAITWTRTKTRAAISAARQLKRRAAEELSAARQCLSPRFWG